MRFIPIKLWSEALCIQLFKKGYSLIQFMILFYLPLISFVFLTFMFFNANSLQEILW